MEIEKLKKIAEARSPGKWTAEHSVIKREDEAWIMAIRSLDEKINEQAPFNITFCAMAANHIDELLAVVEAAKKFVDDCESRDVDLTELMKALQKLEKK